MSDKTYVNRWYHSVQRAHIAHFDEIFVSIKFNCYDWICGFNGSHWNKRDWSELYDYNAQWSKVHNARKFVTQTEPDKCCDFYLLLKKPNRIRLSDKKMGKGKSILPWLLAYGRLINFLSDMIISTSNWKALER